MKQCAWCKATFNIHNQTWQQGPAEILPDVSATICPECVEKFKKEQKKLLEKRGKAA